MKRLAVILTSFLLAGSLSACQVQPTSTPAPTPKGTVPPAATEASPASAATPDGRPTVPAPLADSSRPLARLSAAERNDRFSGPAPMSIQANVVYVATIVTSKGNIVAELYSDTSESANNFITLARNGFYDGLTFHRVEPGFVIQGGDPAGDGTGGPGYTIPAEIKHTHPRGALAWARSGDQVNPQRRSSGSQFYITLDATPFLDGQYTAFGYVIEGMEISDKIEAGDQILRIDISEAQASRLPTPSPTAVPKAPGVEKDRPLAMVPVEQREGLFNMAPAMTIDTKKAFQATIKTPKGDVEIDLDAQSFPISVNNFVMLANLGFYDNMPIAFAEPGSYMILGSPGSQPDSDVGYALPAEGLPSSSKILTGTVSFYPVFLDDTTVLANGSQFFISFVASPDNEVPLGTLGVVSRGMEILEQLATGDIVSSITIAER